MRSTAFATVVAFVAMLALTASVLAGAQRPMSGWYTVGVVSVEQRCGPNALTIGFEGVGYATHLGRMVGSGSNCTEFTLAGGSVGIWDGIATYVGADGSSITMAYDGVQDAPVAGVATVTTTNTVIFGTGRFADAEGTWSGSGTIDFSTGVFSGAIAGWIAY